MKGILLTLVAAILGFIIVPIAGILAPVLYIPQKRFKGYTMEVAIALDSFLGVVCAPLLNITLIYPSGYKFGNRKETISSALGKNKSGKTLTFVGKIIAWFLDDIDHNHVENAVDINVSVTNKTNIS
jgi:8-oxo-dGTP diphosphatase